MSWQSVLSTNDHAADTVESQTLDGSPGCSKNRCFCGNTGEKTLTIEALLSASNA
jgi:hypothetical protein